MNAPDTCPKCGSRPWLDSSDDRKFYCDSVWTRCAWFKQSTACLTKERTQLAARVKELEPYEATCKNPAALWANWLRGTVALPAGIGDVRQEQARMKELEAKLAEVTADRDSWADQADQRATDAVEAMKREEAWREYAGRLATAGDAVSAHAPDDAYRRWFAAKGTKP